MKRIRVEDAVGQVLCHDITQIVRGKTKDAAFRKGHVVTEADIPVLLSLGKDTLFIWEQREGMLHENDAAEILYGICAGRHMSPSEVKEGKIEAIADCGGLLTVDIRRLREINSLGNMMIATRHSHFPVSKGDKLAGMRVIPLVIDEAEMARAKEIGGKSPLLEIYPFRPLKVGIVVTGNEVYHGRIRDTFTPVLEDKLGEYGCKAVWRTVLPDDPEPITKAVLDMADKGAELILCTGGMSVDPDDRTPLAIRNTGARIVSYGAPVLPGAMFLLAYLREDLPVVGLPGCVMYAGRTVFDLVLPRLLAGLRVLAEDLAALGHGGLCLNCATCLYPNCGFGKGV